MSKTYKISFFRGGGGFIVFYPMPKTDKISNCHILQDGVVLCETSSDSLG